MQVFITRKNYFQYYELIKLWEPLFTAQLFSLNNLVFSAPHIAPTKEPSLRSDQLAEKQSQDIALLQPLEQKPRDKTKSFIIKSGWNTRGDLALKYLPDAFRKIVPAVPVIQVKTRRCNAEGWFRQ